MAIYSYRKNQDQNERKDDEVFLRDYAPPKVGILKKISNLPKSSFNGLKDLANTSKLANIIVPGIFVILGGFFIYKEFFPDIQQMIEKNLNYLSQGNVSPVSDQYIDLSLYVSKPIDFPALTIQALKENTLQTDDVSLNYRGTFYLTIPSLSFDHLPVQANVDSTNEDEYLNVLNTKLAHFKNTSLPISDVKNNMMLFGHSASPNYNPKPSDPYVAFSFLSNLKVGDDIYIDIDGKTYHYKMTSSKIVLPTDTSVISGTKGKRTLTLVTCFPAGSNDNRYVAIARPVDN